MNEHNHGSHGECNCGCHCNESIELTEDQVQFLNKLAQLQTMEVVSFVMGSSKSKHLASVALAPVHLEDRADSMETVKQTAATINTLHEYGIIDVDYDSPIENSDYALYKESDLFRLFCDTIEEGKNREGFVFDIARLECGNIALTGLGQEVQRKFQH